MLPKLSDFALTPIRLPQHATDAPILNIVPDLHLHKP